MKTRLFWLGNAVLALVLGVQFASAGMRVPTVQAHATWGFQPKTFAEARKHAQLIVLAEVVSVEQGPDDIVPAANEPGGEARLPTQRVTLKVSKSYKGAEKRGALLTLVQTGGIRQVPVQDEEPALDHHDAAGAKGPADAAHEADEKHVPQAAATKTMAVNFVLADDPLYEVGEKYLLFLERGQRNPDKVISIAPEGRYRVEKNGTLRAMVDNAATEPARGKPLPAVERELGSN